MNNSDFPTVGDSPLSYVGNGVPQPNVRGRMVPRNKMGTGSSPTGSKVNRTNSLKMQDSDGPRCFVQETLYKANAADASAQPRSLRIMPSAAGVSDFWKARTVTSQPMV